MKKLVFSLLLCLSIAYGYGQSRFWVSTIGGNWNNTANWSATSGGAGGATVPTTGNLAVFNGVGGRNGNCLVDIAVNVGGITVSGYTGVIDLLGNTFTTTGANIFTSGTVANTGVGGSMTLNNTTLATTFNGTAFTTATVTGTSGDILFNGSVFGSVVNVTKANNANDTGTGNNTFNAAVTLTNASTSTLFLGNTNKDTYNNTLTLNINNTGSIAVNNGGATAHVLNGNVVINYNSTGAVFFGNSNGPSTLAAGKTITVGTVGAAGTGNLTLKSFSASSTAQTIALSGNLTSVLTIGPGSTFAGALSATAPSLFLTSSNFQATSTFTKTGTPNDDVVGGNTFTNGTILNNGDGDWNFGNTNPDVFNGPAIVTTTGAGRIQIGVGSAGNIFNGTTSVNHGGAQNGNNFIFARNSGSTVTFNGTVTLNETNSNTASGIIIGLDGAVTFNANVLLNISSGRGILFGGDASTRTATVTLANGFTIKEASAGSVSTGIIPIYRLTQVGSTAQALNFTGSAQLTLGPANTFNGNVNFVAPQLYLNGSTYNGTAYLEKTSAGGNIGTGGNVFNAATTLVNSGSANFGTANNTADTFNGDLTLTNTGTDGVFVATNVPGTQFNGNLIVNCTGGLGIFFSNNTGGFGTQAAGKSISVGATGFTAGELRFRRFTQNGTTPSNLVLTGSSLIRYSNSSLFGGPMTAVAPNILFDGTTFNGVTNIEKNGTSNNAGNGGCTFNAATTLTDSGSGYLLTGANSPDIFNADLTVNQTGSSQIYLAWNVPGNQFNGNIIVNSIAGGGISICNNTGGSAIQANGKTITVGALGFTVGELALKRFSQNAPVNLAFTGLGSLRVGPSSSFGSTFTSVTPQVYLDGATFASNTYIEKNASGNNNGFGGNTFNAVTNLVSSGSGYFMTGQYAADVFNADVTITNVGSDIIYMAYNAPGTQFNGNVFLNSTQGQGIWFCQTASGSATLAAGKTISVGGYGFLIGDLRLPRFTQVGATAQNITLTSSAVLHLGPTSSFDGAVTFISPSVYFDAMTFNGVTYIEKNGSPSNFSSGTSTFNAATTLVNSGSGVFRTGGSNIFNGPTVFTSTGSGDMLFENTSGSTYNGTLTLNNIGSTSIRMSYFGNTALNGDVIFNNTSPGNIYFNESASATTTLAATKTMSVGATGFTNGQLLLYRFTQVGATAQTLLLTSIATLHVGPSSSFDGAIDFRAPQLYLDGATYNGSAYLEKTGPNNSTGTGNNTFAGPTTIANSGSNVFRTNGNNVFNGTTTINNPSFSDILLELVTGSTYNGDVFMNNTGTANIRAAYSGASFFNGNITVNSNAGLGIFFSENVLGSATLATGKSIVTGGLGFSSGQLILQRFTQLGPTAQTLLLTANSILVLGPTSVFNGNVNFKAPQLFLQGTTYNGTAALEKTGATNNDSSGSNIFNGVTSLTNSGSGWLRLARAVIDQFNNDLTLTNTGTSFIYLSDIAAGSTYNGNIVVNSTLGGGIEFGNGNGSSTLANGKTISVGGLGFNTGELKLQNFSQVGATPQVVALTGTADIRVGPTSSFAGNVDFRAPQVYLDGATYNGTAYIEKNGGGVNQGLGNNTFNSTANFVNTTSGQFRTNGNSVYNGTTTFLNSGTNDILFELNTGSTYNGDVTFTNTGSSYVRVAYQGTTTFNGNIVVNSLNATGVYFCENTAGFATLANGKTISVGATGFSAGELRITRFTQLGTTPQALVLTGSAVFRTATATTWNGNLTVTGPTIFLDGTIFNGTSTFIKNGNSADNSNGGNTFGGNASFTNSGTGIFRLANATGDVFSANALFTQTSGTIQPAYTNTSTIAGDVTVNSTTPIIFSGGTAGNLTFNGTGAQAISKTGTSSPTFTRLVMSKASGAVTLNTDINIATSATFTTGVINSTATNIVNFANNATTTGASNASYVEGPVKKTGSQAFSFPVGNAGIFRAIGISAPGSSTDAFTAQYFKATQPFGGQTTYAASLQTVSTCEYWTLARTTGTSNVFVTLSWNSPDCTAPYITDLTKLRVARWNGTNWLDLNSNGAPTGNATTGTVTSLAAVTAFTQFTLGSSSKVNPLPIELVSFSAVMAGTDVQLSWITASELNNDFFTVERSDDGAEFASVVKITGAGTTPAENKYAYLDVNPGSGILYYRLRQTDFDGKSTLSDIVKLIPGEISSLEAWPNPSRAGKVVQMNYTGTYQVYNSHGLLIATIEKTNKVDTSGLGSGVYLLRANNGMLVRLVVE